MPMTSASVAFAAAGAAGALYLVSRRPAWLFGVKTWQFVGEVTALHVYPVKSCRGFEVETMELDTYGPKLDRRFMITDENGRFITQRQEAILSQIFVAMRPDGSVTLSLQKGPTMSRFTFTPATAVTPGLQFLSKSFAMCSAAAAVIRNVGKESVKV